MRTDYSLDELDKSFVQPIAAMLNNVWPGSTRIERAGCSLVVHVNARGYSTTETYEIGGARTPTMWSTLQTGVQLKQEAHTNAVRIGTRVTRALLKEKA